MARFFRSLVSCSFFLLQGIASAQVAGIYDFGPFDATGFDTINRGNLNTHFAIPIFSKPGRGGFNFYYALTYDSLIWSPVDSEGDAAWTPVQEWGWTDVTNVQYGYVSYNTEILDCTSHGLQLQYSVYNQFFYYDNKGNRHKIPYSFTNTCGHLSPPSGTGTYSITDNSGYTMYRNGLSWVAVAKYGAQFAVPAYLSGTAFRSQPKGTSGEDTNGNVISTSSSGIFTDTMGKTALTMTGSGTPSSPVVYTYTDSNGTSRTVTVNYTSFTVQTAFGVTGTSEYSQTGVSLVSSIVYSADSSSYSFTYEQTPGNPSAVTGRIASITLRTGGTITYTYTGGNHGIEPDGTTAGFTRITTDGSTSYVRSGITSSQSTTTITDAASNATVASFLLNSSGYFYEIDLKHYQGAPTGTPLSEVQTCYNTSQLGCTGNSVSTAFASILRYYYLNSSSAQGYDYQTFSGPELLQSDYDQSTGLTTYNDYNSYTNGYGIPFYRLADEYIQSSGTTINKAVFTYDGTTPTPTSGLPQHGTVSTPRGNLTLAKQWLNSSGSSTINMSFGYDDAGQILTQTDTNNKTTTLTYDSATDTLLTNVAYPTVNGVQLTEGIQPDVNTGLPSNTTDANGKVTSFVYDGLMRPITVNYPDTGKTSIAYQQNQMSIYDYQNSSSFVDTETLYDGYGRISRTAVANGQATNPWYQQDTCYDTTGNVIFRSYRYQGTGFGMAKTCSGSGGDSYAHDAVGRLLSLTHGDGTMATWAYNQGTTKSIDENNVTRLTTTNLHGQVTGVCEISSNASMPGSGSPTSCNMGFAGTGFKTNYLYGYPSYSITVNQGTQSRLFQIDWAGRPSLIQEPEAGQTSYSYAYNATGLAVTQTRPQANQTGGNLTTTTSQYDALGRIVSISYTDGTPTKTFSYDSSAGWSAPTQTNLLGRLSETSVPGASTIFSYDQVGRINALGECTPSNCGTSNRSTAYTYDLVGNTLTSTDGAGVTDTYTYSVANELLSLTSSLNDSQHPGSLVTSVQNGPFGPLNWHLGNGLNGVRQYDSLGRVTGGWVCSGSTQANCSGGSTVYSFTAGWKGPYLTSSYDSTLSQNSSYGYDEFGRLTSMTVNSGTPGSYSYTYDRWGNRWTQAETSGSGGPQPNLSFNTSTNQISSTGYLYDAAGNLMNDGTYSYSYDAEGNLTMVGPGGSTAKYTYDALNNRVRIDQGGTSTEYLFNPGSQHVSSWDVSHGTEDTGWMYWDTMPLAFYFNGTTQFEHQDWLGTERTRTTYNRQIGGSYSSLPFGDAFTVISGNDWDPHHFADTDQDSTSNEHAQFREYSNMSGRWMAPDAYAGSYDPINPQSMNRYAYVLNNSLSFIDPAGLDEGNCNDPTYRDSHAECPGSGAGGGDGGGGGGGGAPAQGNSGGSSVNPLVIWGNNPGNLGESLGLPEGMRPFPPNILAFLGLDGYGCEFGACGPMASGLEPGQTQGGPNLSIYQPLPPLQLPIGPILSSVRSTPGPPKPKKYSGWDWWSRYGSQIICELTSTATGDNPELFLGGTIMGSGLLVYGPTWKVKAAGVPFILATWGKAADIRSQCVSGIWGPGYH